MSRQPRSSALNSASPAAKFPSQSALRDCPQVCGCVLIQSFTNCWDRLYRLGPNAIPGTREENGCGDQGSTLFFPRRQGSKLAMLARDVLDGCTREHAERHSIPRLIKRSAVDLPKWRNAPNW